MAHSIHPSLGAPGSRRSLPSLARSPVPAGASVPLSCQLTATRPHAGKLLTREYRPTSEFQFERGRESFACSMLAKGTHTHTRT